jgi:hypothetical protein
MQARFRLSQYRVALRTLIFLLASVVLSASANAQAQAPARNPSSAPVSSPVAADVVPRPPDATPSPKPEPTLPITVLPRILQPSNGKLPASVTVAVFEGACDGTRGTDLSSNYALDVTGSGLSFSSSPAKTNKCVITQSLSIDSNTTPGTYSVLLIHTTTNAPVGSADLTVLDSTAGPIPPGLPPQVDVMWNVMSQNNCGDVFGTRIAISLYCIQLKIGNNSGHPLQLAGIGFTNRLDELVKFAGPMVTISNSSYASTRAVLLHQEMWNPRNVIYHMVEATGLVMAGFLPYYSGIHTPNAKTHFAAAASIVSGPLLQAFNLVAPDPILSQLNDLDDQSFRDSVIIPNNTQVQTVVFVEKQALTQSLRELKVRLNKAAETATKEAADAAKRQAADPVEKQAEDAAEKQADDDQAAILNKMADDTASSVNNSESPLSLRLFGKGKHDPLLVKLALGNVVIVGEEIEYLQRIQVQSNNSASAVANVTLSPAAAQVPSNTTQQFTATVTNDQNGAGVTWALSGQSCKDADCGVLGSVTATTVILTSPASPPSPNPAVTITATSKADSTKSGTASVTITPKITVTIQQKSSSTNAGGGPIIINATTTDPSGAGVKWTLSDSACSAGSVCGTLTNPTINSVSYTPPKTKPNPNTVTLTATSVTDSKESDSAKITIN